MQPDFLQLQPFVCSLSLVSLLDAKRGMKALRFFFSISATAVAREEERSSVLSSFWHPLHLQSGAQILPPAKQPQYRFRQPDRSHRQCTGLPFSILRSRLTLSRQRRAGTREEQAEEPAPFSCRLFSGDSL